MSDIAIKFENISKQYHLGKIGTGTLSHDLNRWWTVTVLRKEDPYLKVGEVNDRSQKSNSDFVWALKNIDFEVKQGEVLGIIGKNGAGKSTLLKILSRVTTPTTGRITSYGRIASLLEVGTGFHPEMTGRENIFMNGSIMGMNKSEIRRKFDEIVDFSGIERYIDTPVKRYSSGMTVRLGFAIAAHLEPDILVVDEVLAVGDAEFQKKAIGKMQDVSKGEGRTVLFVSHNLAAVNSLCNKGLVIENGSLAFLGEIAESIDHYLLSDSSKSSNSIIYNRKDRNGAGRFIIYDIKMVNKNGKESEVFLSGDKINFVIKIKNLDFQKTFDLRLDFGLNDSSGVRISWFSTSLFEKTYTLDANEYYIMNLEIAEIPLATGQYSLTSNLMVNGKHEDWVHNAIFFNIINGDYFKSGKVIEKKQGSFLIKHNFKHESTKKA